MRISNRACCQIVKFILGRFYKDYDQLFLVRVNGRRVNNGILSNVVVKRCMMRVWWDFVYEYVQNYLHMYFCTSI